jgi:alkylation response protein AidB-like acyl-CoA dehydrogenase
VTTTTSDVQLDDPAAWGPWLDEQWDPDLTVAQWWERLAAVRLSDPRLAAPWGRGWPRDRTVAFFKLLNDRKILTPPYGMGNFLVIPTLLEHASPEIIERFVPNILNGQHGWCQLFSEPNAGSDLAGLQTRAERDGDEWVVSGQKVWTTGGQWADYAILVARTDPGVPKHRGLTYFVIPMRQPGIEVRPLREMTGEAMFNEVFLDEARLPADWVVGDIGDGWRVTNSTLRHERAGIGGDFLGGSGAAPGTVAGHLDQPAKRFLKRREAADVAMVVNFENLLEVARQRGRTEDPVVRQHLAGVFMLEKVMTWHLSRMKAGATTSGVDGNLAKLRNSQMLAAVRQLSGELLGPHATLWGADAATGGAFQRHTVYSPAPSIYGGADQIQRNIVGERGLGLPREPDNSRDTPFNQLLQNALRPA